MSQIETARMLDGHALDALLGRSLLTTQEWSTADLASVRAVARSLAHLDRQGIRTPLCPDELAWAVFFDQSTRTKSAWAGAAARLGMQPVIVDGSSTQVSHGETAVETGAMLGMNAHAMGIRHDLILGEGNTFIRDVKQGIDDYLDATDDSRCGADRQPAVRRRPPHADDGRPAVARGQLRRSRRPEHHGQLGLLAVVRQAAVGRRRG